MPERDFFYAKKLCNVKNECGNDVTYTKGSVTLIGL